jgi:hypothetical protein
MPVIEGMMKVYARDCMSKAVVNLDSSETETFEQLLALNVYLSAGDVVQCAVRRLKRHPPAPRGPGRTCTDRKTHFRFSSRRLPLRAGVRRVGRVRSQPACKLGRCRRGGSKEHATV